MKITKLTFGLISGISLLAFPLTTFAAESVDGESASVIEEITVTARKREESVLDIPESVSAISGDDIEKQGIKVFTGHKKEHVKNADIVVYSSAIKPDNIERKDTKKRKLAQFSRGNCLSQFMAPYQRRIVVAGTHGKTSTTGMLIHVFDAAGVIPSFMIGGEMAAYGCNGRFSESSTFVTESDESDGSFLKLPPTYSIVTNIDKEHLDFYGNYP